jgi:micrococcal nuclease
MTAARRQVFAVALAVFATTATILAQQVTRVIDGDTMVVEGVGSVRLIGVDTPETVDPRKPVQYFGAEATAFTRRRAEGKIVRLEFEGASKDAYNRILAYVYLPDGTLLNGEIIRQGFGHAYTTYPFGKMDEFRRLQREAAESGKGLWARGDVAADLPISNANARLKEESAAETVYATRTGTKYHRAGCRYLARSQIPMSLREAVARYGPCSVCKPPSLAATSLPETSTAPRPSTSVASDLSFATVMENR